MEHILHVVAFREPTKAGGTQEGFLEENPQPLTIIPPSTHFFIHMFNKHLGLSVAFASWINWHLDLSHRDGCHYLIPHHG